MSLIIARKEKENIFITSDTKLSFPDEREITQGLKRRPSDGIIKSTIINFNLCISFAGAVDYADEAIKKIHTDTSIEEVFKILFEIHQLSAYETDFIICIGTPKATIFELKENRLSEVSAAWIGSQRAFNRFQDYMLRNREKKQEISFFKVTPLLESNTTDLYSRISDSFDAVIGDEDIPEVDGFKVNVIFENKFMYRGYFHSYLGNQEMKIKIPSNVSSVQFPVPFNGPPSNGNYTINFFNSSEDYKYVGVHVLQGNFGIVYIRENNGLLRPNLFHNYDEIDFLRFC